MLTRTRTADLLAPAGQDPPPELPAASTPGQPPVQAGESAHPGQPDQSREPDQAGEALWSGLRLVAVPAGWPPYDCEAHGAACPASELEAGRRPPRPTATASPAATALPTALPAATALPTAEAAPGRDAGAGRGPRQDGGASHLPELSAAWPGQFAQVLVEILAGLRPAKQLAPWTTERVRAQVDLLGHAVAAGQRPRIRRVMTSRPTAGVVEMTTVVGFGSRSRALAVRFERVPARPPAPGRPARPARWLCTEIETGLPDLRI